MSETPPEPVAVPPAAAPAPEPTAPPAAPWSADLEQRFADPAVRSQVDEYLRTVTQPHLTRLEQELAPARELYTDLTSDPEETLTALVEELYGEDVATQFAGLFEQDPAEPGEPAATPAEVPAHLQQMYEDYTARQQQEAYDTAVTQLKTQDADLVEEEFAPFVVSADGDLSVAYQGYTKWREGVQSRYAPAAPAAPAVPAAPPTLGADGVGAAAPPVLKKHANLADAMDEWLNEDRAKAAPPTVGSV